jgi:hypothetical protein
MIACQEPTPAAGIEKLGNVACRKPMLSRGHHRKPWQPSRRAARCGGDAIDVRMCI